MATSPTDIANLALSEIGASRISSLTEDTTEAQSCALHYELVRDSLLRRYQWSHSTARATLSPLSTPPPSEWDTAWQLPTDCVRFIRIAGDTQHTPNKEFSIEGRTLLTSGTDSVSIIYITNASHIPHWDPLFTEALTLKLASKIANDIKKNSSEANDALNKFRNLTLKDATTADAKEVKSGENFGTSALLASSTLNQLRYRYR